MSVHIRPATMADYDELCTLFEEADALHRRSLPHMFRQPQGPARSREYVEVQVDNDELGLFVAEEGGELLGLVFVYIRAAPDIPLFVPRRLAVIDNLAVRGDRRRQGIGRALLERAHDWAREQGASYAQLTVYDFNTGAQRFYRALGYRPLSRLLETKL